MKRIAGAAVVLLFLIVPTAHAAQTGKERFTGNWLIRFFTYPNVRSYWMLKIDAKANGTLEVIPDPNFPQCKLKDFKVAGESVSFTILLADQPVTFAFKFHKGEVKKLYGTITVQGHIFAAQLQATDLTSLKEHDPFTELPRPKGDYKELRELLVKVQDDFDVFEVAEVLIGEAAKEKISAADLRGALAPALKGAKLYSDVWYQEVAAALARKMAGLNAYAALGEELIQVKLKALEANAPAEQQLRLLAVLAISLHKQGKKDELAKVQLRMDDLEVLGHEEYEKLGLGFTTTKVKGRKGARVVLVELFTGAACPPCVDADLAFEGLSKTYAPSEVILLQYHLHMPPADALAHPESIARGDYYGEKLEKTPAFFFNGKREVPGGVGPKDAETKYKEYCKVIDSLVGAVTSVKLTASATRVGDKVALEATVQGYKLDKQLRLRFALVEPWVRYAGPNGRIYHSQVVRAMPGGLNGIAVTKASQEVKLNLDLADVRQSASKHLDKYADLDGQRPFSYRELRLVVFLQDDTTQEVLNALEVRVVTFKEQ
jgi:hypothetical protein